MDKLKVDPERYAQSQREDFVSTGIYVRCEVPGDGFDAVDIWCLEQESLMRWLRSRGGANEWAEITVALLLGHCGTQ
jgi:hypothetical protein